MNAAVTWPNWGRPKAVFLFYLVLLLVLHAPVLFFGQTLYLADITYNIEPTARFVRDTFMRTDTLPIWNPYVLSGAPQIQVCWPIAYLPGLVFTMPFGAALGWFILIHQLAAGIGGYLWQYFVADEKEPARRTSAAMAGLIFMLCGYMTGSSINIALVATACWIPLGLCLVHQIVRNPRLWCLAAFALVFGMQVTAGRPELVIMSVLLYAAYLLYLEACKVVGAGIRVNSAGESLKFLSKRICISAFKLPAGMLIGGMVIGILFGAINLLPMLEMAVYEPKVGSLATLNVNYWSAGWYEFASILLSQPLGRLGMANYQSYPTYPGDMPYITSLYLGAPVLSLAILGFCRRTWTQRWFWLVVLAVAGIASAGEFAGLVPLLSRVFPDVLIFRFPVKLSIFVLLALVAAAAEGWRSLFAGEDRKEGIAILSGIWIFLCVIAIMLQGLSEVSAGSGSALLGSVVHDKGLFDGWHQLPVEMLLAGLSGTLLTVISLPALLKSMGSKTVTRIWLAIVAAMLMINGTKFLWQTVDSSFFEQCSTLAEWLGQRRAGSDPIEFRVLSLLEEPLVAPPVVANLPADLMDKSFMQYARAVLKPNTNIDSLIQLTNGVSTIPTWTTYFLSAGLLPRSSQSQVKSHPAGKSDLPLARWCQATSSYFVLTSNTVVSADGYSVEPAPRLDPRWFNLVQDSSALNLRVYEVSKVKPRWHLQDQYKLMSDRNAALQFINRADTTGYNPSNCVLITDLGPSGGKLTQAAFPESKGLQILPGEELGLISLVRETRLSTKIYLQLKVPAFLVVNDSYYPGWEARDNGGPIKIYLADGLYRAVYLSPGRHEVAFVYKPYSLFWGEILSKLTSMAIAVLFVVAWGIHVNNLYLRRKDDYDQLKTSPGTSS